MFYLTKDKLKFYYEVHGNKEGAQTLLFLNGVSQSTAAWYLMKPAFEEKYRVILCDFIFQGQSDKEGEYRNFDQHANDVLGLLDHLSVKDVSLIGISYGSLVAQHFALLFPQRLDKLVLLSTFAHKTPYFEAIELAWEHALAIGGYSLMLDVMLPTVLSERYFENPLIPLMTLKSNRAGINTDVDALKKLMKATRLREDYRQRLHDIHQPTLIIHGEKDALLPVHMGRAVADSIHASHFEVIPQAGHTLNLEAAPQTTALILAFL
ncbi:MAG: alpha/beta fold hydrolase [Bacteroidia bacterium]